MIYDTYLAVKMEKCYNTLFQEFSEQLRGIFNVYMTQYEKIGGTFRVSNAGGRHQLMFLASVITEIILF